MSSTSVNPPRDEVAGEPLVLAVDDDPTAELEDVGALAEQAHEVVDARLRSTGVDHDLDTGPIASLEHPRAVHREAAVGCAEQRAARTEQGSVEIDVYGTKHRWRP